MKENEKKVQEAASFYTEQILGIDFKQTEFVYRSIKPFFKGKLSMELGPASGYMTKYLVNDFEDLHLVEGSLDLLQQIPEYKNVTRHHSMFENFTTPLKFDTVVMSHVLEHIEQPVSVLQRVKTWMAANGVLIISVPNARSLHRIVAVKMGLLKTENTLNERDHILGHYRVYDMKSLCDDITKAGYKIIHKGGSFLKPLSNGQIDQYWTPAMVEGFYEAGKEFAENCAEIFVVCTP